MKESYNKRKGRGVSVSEDRCWEVNGGWECK